MEKEFNKKVIGNFGEVGVVVDDTITKDHSEVIMHKEKEFNLSEKIETKMWAEDMEDPTTEPDQFGDGLWMDDVKEFIKIVEGIIISRKSVRLQLIELGKAIGDKLK